MVDAMAQHADPDQTSDRAMSRGKTNAPYYSFWYGGEKRMTGTFMQVMKRAAGCAHLDWNIAIEGGSYNGVIVVEGDEPVISERFKPEVA